jgi:hypothetical protein
MKNQIFLLGITLVAIIGIRCFSRDTFFAIQFILGIVYVFLGEYKKTEKLLKVGLIVCLTLSNYLVFDWLFSFLLIVSSHSRLLPIIDIVVYILLYWFFWRIFKNMNSLQVFIDLLIKWSGLRFLFTWVIFQIITIIVMLRDGVFNDYSSNTYLIISLFNFPAVLSANFA